MTAKRKVIRLTDCVRPDIRLSLRSSGLAASDQSKALKDIHLIEAALASDLIVLSADDEALKIFSVTSAKIGTIKEIMWINPVSERERFRDWIATWAKRITHWTLGGGL